MAPGTELKLKPWFKL